MLYLKKMKLSHFGSQKTRNKTKKRSRIGRSSKSRFVKFDKPKAACSRATKKLNVVLDLDNTLISSLTEKERKRLDRQPSMPYKDFAQYRMFVRPYLQDFLTFLFKNFNVSVWTAASKSYMEFVIDNFVDPSGKKLKRKLYDVQCDESRKQFKGVTPKNLKYLFQSRIFNRNNTLIIDDLKHVKHAQPELAIQCPYFDASDPEAHNDFFLKDLIGILSTLKRLHSYAC